MHSLVLSSSNSSRRNPHLTPRLGTPLHPRPYSCLYLHPSTQQLPFLSSLSCSLSLFLFCLHVSSHCFHLSYILHLHPFTHNILLLFSSSSFSRLYHVFSSKSPCCHLFTSTRTTLASPPPPIPIPTHAHLPPRPPGRRPAAAVPSGSLLHR